MSDNEKDNMKEEMTEQSKKVESNTLEEKESNLDPETKSKKDNDEELLSKINNEKEGCLDENDENVQEDISSITNELNETKDKLLRALAETENIRKLMDKMRADSTKYGVQPLARELLNVVDNFDRALPDMENEKKEPILEGFYLIKKEIISILEKFNIKKNTALGENFDANYHQAMYEKESEKYEAGKICEIIQEGYSFHDRLLRPSLVAVAIKSKEEDNKIIEEDVYPSQENKEKSSEEEKDIE